MKTQTRLNKEYIPRAIVHAERLIVNDIITFLQRSNTRLFQDSFQNLRNDGETRSYLGLSLMVNVYLSFGIASLTATFDIPLLSKIFFCTVFALIGIGAGLCLVRPFVTKK